MTRIWQPPLWLRVLWLWSAWALIMIGIYNWTSDRRIAEGEARQGESSSSQGTRQETTSQ